MRKVILQDFISLDGYASGPDGNVDFVPAITQGDDGFDRAQLEFARTIDTILLGRVTYQLFADYWPKITTNEDKVADVLNHTPKIVFSKTLERAPWGKYAEATVIRTDAAAAVRDLKRQTGKDLVIWGSISLAQSLMQAGVIDEYRVVVCPLTLGTGVPLFGAQTPKLQLRLEEIRRFGNGEVELTYR